MPAMRSPETSTTCSAQGSWPAVGARLVLRVGGRPVRLDGKQPRTLASDAGPEAPRDDVVVRSEPQAVGRHRPRGVLAQQRGERGHVVALERVHVAFEQRALLRVERPQRLAVGDIRRLHRGVRPLERAVHRRDRRLEQLGDLGRLPAEDVAQHQDRPLLRRQMLERRDEREPDRLPRLGHLGGVAAFRHDPIVGHRQHPGGLGQRLTHQRDVGVLCGPEVDRAGSALGTAQHVEAHVRRDAVEPRPQRGTTLEPGVGAPGAEHRLLHGVVGLEGRPEHAVGVGGELAAVCLEPGLQIFGRSNHAHHGTTRRQRGTHRRRPDEYARRGSS